MPFLEVADVEVSYGEVEALRGVSLSVNESEIVALVGANGAGKSTLINTISGLLRPSAGSIRFAAEDITSVPPHRLPGRGLVQVPEGRRLFPTLSVADNLAMGAFHAAARSNASRTRARVYELMPVLEERAQQAAGTLSGGQQQMLALGRALMAAPKLLMLDEPSLGLAPIIVKEMFTLIETVRDEGTSILLVEQNVRHALAISDRAYAVQNGRIVMSGTGLELRDSPSLASAMLGIAETA
jgi:branched-chain amino acid transport system ATP-binding protein